MNNLTLNFTSAASMNITTTQQISIMDIAVYSFNLLVGLPMHTYVIWLIVTGRESGVASEFFNFTLSVCEIGTCLNCLFFIMANWLPGISSLSIFLIGLGITGRPLFQCLISVERYLAVVHPVTFLRFKPIRYKVICSIAVWIMILGSCAVCMVTMSSNFITYTWFFLMQLLFYISMQLYFCLTVLAALKKSGPGEKGREKEEENHVKRRAFYLILIITVNMFVIYLPFVIAALFTLVAQIFIRELWNAGFIFSSWAVFYSLSFIFIDMGNSPAFVFNKACSSDIYLLKVTLDHKTSLKSLGYICNNSQKYIVWLKTIDFSLIPIIIRKLSKDHVP